MIHEDAIKIGGFTKAPDYCFRIGGARKFFLEAKKPLVNIREDIHPAFQLRRYAWSSKLPLSILSDFEEFAVYDCRVRPQKADKASVARIMYMRFDEYEDRWDEIVSIFSRDAILKGSFDKYVESTKAKRGTADVDEAFLKEIETWRDILAKNIALRNPALSQRELNFAVQITIDRIIFLRICEDRGIEDYGRLMALQNGGGIYARLLDLYRKADARYNSGLFHFEQEKGRPETRDTLTPKLSIDDKVLKDIFKGLYYPDSPYEFSVLPSDILGQVYEQFLGKVIRLTSGHRAVVEEKPEVKKAGGVYYTPTYIVDYIVKNTVGKLVEGKTPNQVSKLKIVDPACGSGSFLIGAYQYLLNWHRDYYENDRSGKHAKHIYQSRSGEWRLTTSEKKRILLNNIYGVDIDSQAVEVTKLSLLLKVLEGETEESINAQMRLFQERALPDLSNNIKCGNSLIGPDFYDNQQISLFDEEEAYRINVFDWQAEFPEIFANGGFDAVIGNPPYIRIQALKEWAPKEVEFYKTKYVSASKGNYDIYVVFAEKGLGLLNDKGLLGYILPHKFFNAQYGQPLRGIIAEGKHLSQVVHFGHQQVFKGATTYTCLMFLSKAEVEQCTFNMVEDVPSWLINNKSVQGTISSDKIRIDNWNFMQGDQELLFSKLQKIPQKLGDLEVNIFQGIITGADKVFVLEHRDGRYWSKCLNRLVEIEHQILQPLLKGQEIHRYEKPIAKFVVIFPYSLNNGISALIPESQLAATYPKTFQYLNDCKKFLCSLDRVKKKVPLYAFSRNQNIASMARPKIILQVLAKAPSFTLDNNGEYVFVGGGTAGGYGIALRNNNVDLRYLLGLLNSKLLDFFHKKIATSFRGGFFAYSKQYLQQLPIPEPDSNFPIVDLVDQMLELNKKLDEAKTSHEQSVIQRQIDATDRQIDQLVYQLYNLTEEEIKIVEESTQ